MIREIRREEMPGSEGVEAILSIETGNEQQAQMILVLLGIKPAMDLSLYYKNTPPEEAEQLLTSAGLTFIKKETSEKGEAVVKYAVAQDFETARRLLLPKSDAEYGELMGYPKTAVDAFVSGEVYEGAIPLDIQNSVFSMKFSPEHHSEEFEVVRGWIRAVEEVAPGLVYKHIM